MTMNMTTSPEWIDGNGKINEPVFCRVFCNDKKLICVQGKFYGLDGILTDNAVSHTISEMIMPYITSNISAMVKKLTEALKYYCYREEITVAEDEIHLLNGVLKTNGEWTPEKQFCVNRMNIEYYPEMSDTSFRPQRFISFLSDMLDEQDIMTLQEYLGYCLIPCTKGQTALFIIGNGGEGKSCIRNVMQSIFGNAMITAGFHRIETDKFFRSNLTDKLLMIDDDMQLNALPSTGYIKSLITSDAPIDVEEKGQQSRQAKLYARFICLGNDFPKALYDKSNGFGRRLMIHTTKPVPKGRVNNPHLSDKLIKEKKQIFAWMFEGLMRLIGNDFHFTVSDKTRNNSTEVMADGCNIPDFLEDKTYITFGADKMDSTQGLYSSYVDWCHKNLLTVLNQNTFSTWFRHNASKYGLVPTNHIPIGHGREVRGYKGICSHYRSIISGDTFILPSETSGVSEGR